MQIVNETRSGDRRGRLSLAGCPTSDPTGRGQDRAPLVFGDACPLGRRACTIVLSTGRTRGFAVGGRNRHSHWVFLSDCFFLQQNGEIPCAIFSWPLGSHPTPKTSTKRSSTPLGTTHTACAQIQLCSAAGANSPACATPAETVASSYFEAAVCTHHRAQQMPSPPWPRTGKLGRPRARYRCSTSNW